MFSTAQPPERRGSRPSKTKPSNVSWQMLDSDPSASAKKARSRRHASRELEAARPAIRSYSGTTLHHYCNRNGQLHVRAHRRQWAHQSLLQGGTLRLFQGAYACISRASGSSAAARASSYVGGELSNRIEGYIWSKVLPRSFCTPQQTTLSQSSIPSTSTFNPSLLHLPTNYRKHVRIRYASTSSRQPSTSANTLSTGEARDQYQQVENSDNQAELSHELLAGGASFMAMKMFEDRQRKEGE